MPTHPRTMESRKDEMKATADLLYNYKIIWVLNAAWTRLAPRG